MRDGVIAPDAAGALKARLDIAMVGMSGVLAEGRLVHGANGVCITFELAVEEVAPGAV